MSVFFFHFALMTSVQNLATQHSDVLWGCIQLY